MRLTTLALLAVAAIGVPVAAQAPKAFDVASVKPARPDADIGMAYLPGGGVRGSAPLDWLISYAYELQPNRVIGGPDWVRNQSFTIEAKTSNPATRVETNAMLRTLLEDRFRLVGRKDPNGIATVWALKMAREDGRLGPGIRRSDMECVNTPKPPPASERQLRPGQPAPCGAVTDNVMGSTGGGGVPIARLIFFMQLAVGGEIVDRTGLTGLFDFYVQLPRANLTQHDPNAASLFTSVQETLGMKLAREEITREVFVIERVSPPTPN